MRPADPSVPQVTDLDSSHRIAVDSLTGGSGAAAPAAFRKYNPTNPEQWTAIFESVPTTIEDALDKLMNYIYTND